MNFLALIALTQEDDFYVSKFLHFFVLLCWNLKARLVSVANIRYEHVSWDVNAFVINLEKQKEIFKTCRENGISIDNFLFC